MQVLIVLLIVIVVVALAMWAVYYIPFPPGSPTFIKPLLYIVILLAAIIFILFHLGGGLVRAEDTRTIGWSAGSQGQEQAVSVRDRH